MYTSLCLISLVIRSEFSISILSLLIIEACVYREGEVMKLFQFPIPRFFFFSMAILFLPFEYSYSHRHNNDSSAFPNCPSFSSSTCGHLKNVSHLFVLPPDHKPCGYNYSWFQLECLDSRIVLDVTTTGNFSKRYYVQEIDYTNYTMRLIDPGIDRENLASCPFYSYDQGDWVFLCFEDISLQQNVLVAFIHCLSAVNSVKYMKAPLCGNASNAFFPSSKIYSYVMVGVDLNLLVSDLEESCTVDKVVWASRSGPMKHYSPNSSLASIYNGLAYGFELSIFRDCTNFHFEWPRNFVGHSPDVTCVHRSDRVFGGILSAMIIAGFTVLKFVIGIPLLVWLVVHKWRRRHLCMDKTIEEFLQGQNFTPIKYTFWEIKKMTQNFTQKLGEGGHGTVYKGKLRSGPYVAVKLMAQSMATEEDFITEVSTIGQIHHMNIVQLIGFCVEHSKCALVYEFLPNGSLDRYIFNQQSLGVPALTYEKMLDIAIGVARGIEYLHHGCNMQILHFDIKPHNILLDEKFNPKISDFGLARQHPTDESCIHLTVARGTVGYMAPELFYKNIRGISYKADVYSFGMMLMEMVGTRKEINPYVEDTSQINFPLWVYNHLSAGNDIHAADASENEMKMVKKLIIAALWCIQMRPTDRPPMSRVAEMLDGNFEPQMPPKPFIAPREIGVDDHGITRTYSVDYINLDLADD